MSLDDDEPEAPLRPQPPTSTPTARVEAVMEEAGREAASSQAGEDTIVQSVTAVETDPIVQTGAPP